MPQNAAMCDHPEMAALLVDLLFPLTKNDDDNSSTTRGCIATYDELSQHIYVRNTRALILCPCAHIVFPSPIFLDFAHFHLSCGGLRCILDGNFQQPIFQSQGFHEIVVSNIVFQNGYTTGAAGGAVDLVDGSSTFVNCVFDRNLVDAGPGVTAYGGALAARFDEVVHIEDCRFTRNMVDADTTAYGGALACVDCHATMVHTQFLDNTVEIVQPQPAIRTQHVSSNLAGLVQCENVLMDAATDVVLPEGATEHCGRLMTPVDLFAATGTEPPT